LLDILVHVFLSICLTDSPLLIIYLKALLHAVVWEYCVYVGPGVGNVLWISISIANLTESVSCLSCCILTGGVLWLKALPTVQWL